MSDYKADAAKRRDFRASSPNPEDVAPKVKGKRDTKRWCKGVVGRLHRYVVRPTKYDSPGWAWGRGVLDECEECGKATKHRWISQAEFDELFPAGLTCEG